MMFPESGKPEPADVPMTRMSTAVPRYFSPFAIARETFVLPDEVKRAAAELGISPAYEQNAVPYFAEPDRDRIAERLLSRQAGHKVAALSARKR